MQIIDEIPQTEEEIREELNEAIRDAKRKGLLPATDEEWKGLKNKDKICLFPTQREAVYGWEQIQNEFSNDIIKAQKRNLSVTFNTGVTYYFRSVNDYSNIRGYNADIVSIDEFVGERNKE